MSRIFKKIKLLPLGGMLLFFVSCGLSGGGNSCAYDGSCLEPLSWCEDTLAENYRTLFPCFYAKDKFKGKYKVSGIACDSKTNKEWTFSILEHAPDCCPFDVNIENIADFDLLIPGTVKGDSILFHYSGPEGIILGEIVVEAKDYIGPIAPSNLLLYYADTVSVFYAADLQVDTLFYQDECELIAIHEDRSD